MKVHEHYAGRHKQNQLNQRVVYHMEQAAPDRQASFFPQQSLHADANQDKTDLGYGGAGQRPFQVHGKQSQQRPCKHS